MNGLSIKSQLTILLLLALVSTIACLPKHREAFPDTRGRDGASDGDNAAAAAAAQTACGLTTPATVEPALKLLTNRQYNQSMRDLLKAEGEPAQALPSDHRGGGFDTDLAAHALTPTLAQAYLISGQRLAVEYVKNGAPCGDKNYTVACTGPAVASLAQRAFRRPLLDGERQRLTALPGAFASGGLAVKDAYIASVAAVLMAPQFLYRVRLQGQPGLEHAAQYALASSLSYTFWNSMPDSELLNMAKLGELSSSQVIVAQMKRMLADNRAQDFAEAFASQWLGAQNLASTPAAAGLPPALVADLSAEVTAYFGEFLRSNINIRNLLDAPFGYVSNLTAPYYGLAKPATPQLRRVDFSGDQRGGILTQGSYLVQTSNVDQPSPVKRGKWILDNILCQPPAPPPADQVGALQKGDTSLPIRMRLAKHREAPACAGCHALMDPLGLAFEHYDQAGKWRDFDLTGAIDASGALPDGSRFNSAAQLIQLLKADPAFPRCVALKIATFTLGREPNDKELCAINLIADRSKNEAYGLKDLVGDLSLTLLTIE